VGKEDRQMPFARYAQVLRETQRRDVLELVDVERMVPTRALVSIRTLLAHLRKPREEERSEQSIGFAAHAREIAYHYGVSVDYAADAYRRSRLS